MREQLGEILDWDEITYWGTKIKKGDRIELLHTNDPHATLKKGDRGTITGFGTTPCNELQIWVDWDNGSKLALLDGIDTFKMVKNET